MFPLMRLRSGRAALLLLALAACDEAQGVDVQPLPPLQRPSPEARAGLPVVAGTWRFAGWELPARDTVTRGEGMLPPGVLAIRTQRMDSLAGDYLRDGQRFPFVGEVRRDGVVSVVAFGPDGAGSFIAGRVVRDTLWIELTSLSAAQTWSTGARAALLRTPVPRPFVRYQGGYRPLDVDSIRADSIRIDSLRRADSLRLADSARAPVPGQVPAQAPGVRPAAPPAAAPGQARPPAAAPQRQPPAATGAQPAPKQSQPKQSQPKQTQPRRTDDTARRRDTTETERRRETPRRRQDTLRIPAKEEPEEEEEQAPPPPRPDTVRPREPVIIP